MSKVVLFWAVNRSKQIKERHDVGSNHQGVFLIAVRIEINKTIMARPKAI
jgi:hypothetical protein